MSNIYSWESGNDKPIDRATLNKLLIKYKNSALFSSELTDYFEALINNEFNYIRDYSTCCSKIDVKLEELNLNFYDQIITSNIYYMILSFFEQYCNIDNVYSKCKDGEFYYKYNDLLLINFSRKIDNNSMFQESTNEEKYIINMERYDTSLLEQYKQKIQQSKIDILEKYTAKLNNHIGKKIRQILVKQFEIYDELTYEKKKKISQQYNTLLNSNHITPDLRPNSTENIFLCLVMDFNEILEYYEKIDELEKSQSNTYFVNEINSAFLEYIGLNENDFKKTSDSIEQEEKSSIHIGKKLVLTNTRNKVEDQIDYNNVPIKSHVLTKKTIIIKKSSI